MEYWILLDDKDILAVFSTLQECLCWRPEFSPKNPTILRMKMKEDHTFSRQIIFLDSKVFDY